MIKIENLDVYGWEAAIRGMRNPMNSWDNSDSHWCVEDCPMIFNDHEPAIECNDGEFGFCIGKNDLKLMHNLARAGSDHGKFLRMINVTCDIIAPLYWWKEFDTYKIGTVANSCSTMHKIHAKEFSLDDFSHEHLSVIYGSKDRTYYTMQHILLETIEALNMARKNYLATKNKDWWWQMIQLLPSSYNQRRTVQLNYAVLLNVYRSRKDHKLDEWREFCAFVESKLPYFKMICLDDCSALYGFESEIK